MTNGGYAGTFGGPRHGVCGGGGGTQRRATGSCDGGETQRPRPSPPENERRMPLVIGFGENSVDYVFRLPFYPQPTAAASKLAIERRNVRPGGQVATTLVACARLGLPARYLGTFGDDEAGVLIRQALERDGVDVSRAVTRHAPNRYAVILLDVSRGERVVLWQRDPRLAIAAGEFGAGDLAGAALVHVDATDAEAAIALAAEARGAGLMVTCDVDQVTPLTTDLLATVSIPILAEHVPEQLTGEKDVERALRRLRQTHAGRLVVTLGAHGAVMLDGERFIEVPGYRVTVVDSTGAGDVFRGALIRALLHGDPPEESLRFANAAAAISCMREGAIDGAPTLQEVHAFVAASGPTSALRRA